MPPKKDKGRGGPAAAPEAQPSAPQQHPDDQCVLCSGKIDLSTEERFAGAHTTLMFAPRGSRRAIITRSSKGAIGACLRPRRIAAGRCGFHLPPPPPHSTRSDVQPVRHGLDALRLRRGSPAAVPANHVQQFVRAKALRGERAGPLLVRPLAAQPCQGCSLCW